MTNTEYMSLAVELAKKGCGWVNPNSMMGAVIVRDGQVIEQGYHEKYDALRTERNALASCESPPAGATICVILEPYCHYGKTPSRTDAILESDIRWVVIGPRDPNPQVSGKGIAVLRSHGIEAAEDRLKDECDALNQSLFHYIQKGTPYVVMKYAMTPDGRIATHQGKSQWITGEAAHRRVHEDRYRYFAIMVGVGTVLADDPLLTYRMENSRNPLRVICSTSLRTPLQARLITSTTIAGTLLATVVTDREEHRPYLEAGCDIVVILEKEDHIGLNCLMRVLDERKIDSVLLEGGGTLSWSALQSGIVNRIQAYTAPKLLGGSAKTPVAGPGADSPQKASRLGKPTITQLGEGILWESEVLARSQGSQRGSAKYRASARAGIPPPSRLTQE